MPAGALEVGEVEEFLRARGYSPLHTERIGHGEWSQAFGFGSGESEFVVRFSAFDEDFRKDQLAAGFMPPWGPIPRLVDIGAGPHGLVYAVSERAHGAYLDDLDHDQLLRALPSVMETIDELRLANISRTRGYGVWDATGNAPHATWREALLGIVARRLDGWRARLENTPVGAGPFDRARQGLSELASGLPDRRHLVHADLLSYNVLVTGEHISAVLDWGSAMYGDWVFDVAWFVFWQPWFAAWSGIDFAAEAQRFFANSDADLTDFDARLRCCLIAIGLDNQAYCAFRGGAERMQQLAVVAERTLQFAQ